MAAANREEYTIILKARDEAKRILENVGKTGVKAGRNAAAAFRKAAKAMRTLGTRGRSAFRKIAAAAKRAALAVKSVTGVFAPLLAVLAAVGGAFVITREASLFSSSMAEVATIADSTTEQLESMRQEVLALAAAHGAAATDVAKGLYQAISAGAEAGAESIDILTQASKLGIAGLADTESSVNAVTSVLNAYHLSADQAADVTDIFFTAVKKGKTSIPEMAASMADATKKAADLGVEFDEVLGIVATATLGGTQTAQAFTQLTAILNALLKKSKEVNALFQDKLGKTFTLQRLRTEGLASILNDLRAAFGDSTDAMTLFLGRSEATSAVLSVTGENAQNLVDVMEAMASRAGATARAFDVQMADPAKRVALAINAIRLRLMEVGGRAIITTLNEFIDKIGGMGTLLDQAEVFATGLSGAVKVLAGALAAVVRNTRDFIKEMGGADNVAAILESTFDVVATSIELAFERGLDALSAFVAALKHVPELVSTIVAGAREKLAGLPGGGPTIDERIKDAEKALLRAGGDPSGAGRDFGFGFDVDSPEGLRRFKAAIAAEDKLTALRAERGAAETDVADIIARMRAASSKALAGDSARIQELVQRLVDQQKVLSRLRAGLPAGEFGPAAPPGTGRSIASFVSFANRPPPGQDTSGRPPGSTGLSLPDLGDLIRRMANFNAERDELMQNVALTFDEQIDAIDKWAVEAKKRNALLVEENAILGEQGIILDGIVDRTVRQGKEDAKRNKQLTVGQQTVKDFSGALENSLGQTLNGLIQGTIKTRDAIKSLLRSLVADFGAALSRRVAAGLVTNLFPAANGAIFPGGLNFPQYAKGGIASKPQLAEIGEGRNKEAVIPMPDNRHVEVKMKGGGANGAGGGLTVVFNLPEGGIGSSSDEDATLRRMMPKITRGIQRAMIADRGFQGSIRSVVGRR